MLPGPGGLVPRIFKILTAEARDPDVHIHQWLTAMSQWESRRRLSWVVFSIDPPQSAGREKDRARYLHAKVWGSTNYASHDELNYIADEFLKKERLCAVVR